MLSNEECYSAEVLTHKKILIFVWWEFKLRKKDIFRQFEIDMLWKVMTMLCIVKATNYQYNHSIASHIRKYVNNIIFFPELQTTRFFNVMLTRASLKQVNYK